MNKGIRYVFAALLLAAAPGRAQLPKDPEERAKAITQTMLFSASQLTVLFAFIAVLSMCLPSFGQTQTTFTIPQGGALTFTTDGSGPLIDGYVQLQNDRNSFSPSSFTIIGQRIGGTVISEAGVPGVVPVTTGRIYAEVNGAATAGIVITNPLPLQITIMFHLTDNNGADVSSGSFTLSAGQQLSRFLTDAPFNCGTPFQGTLTFTSTGFPVGVTALRGYLNERNEFLWTTLPVTYLQVNLPPIASTTYLPHFADGQGWTTQIVLVNPTDSVITGSIQFVSQQGAVVATFPYSVARESSFKVASSGIAPTGAVLSGSVRVVPATGAAPSALSIFSFRNGDGIVVSEAGAAPVQADAFRMYVEETTPMSVYPAIQSGFAVANSLTTPLPATVNLTGLDGSLIATTTITIPANGQIAKMLHDLFPDIAYPVRGLLSVEPPAPPRPLYSSAVAFRLHFNERGEILTTTTPPANAKLDAGTLMVFPQFLNGGGWTSELVLFNGFIGTPLIPGFSALDSGQLTFSQSDGSPFNLVLK
jgi:hypothetical protein